MSRIEKISGKLTRKFKNNKVLSHFYALFDAIDKFLLTPDSTTLRGSHIRDSVDVKRLMTTVMIALTPSLLFGFWNTGHQHFLSYGTQATFWKCFGFGFLKWLPVVLVTYISGLTVEVFFAQIRKEEVAEGFFVTGMLIPMILPPEIPLWTVAAATIFATLFAKEVFGGTGYNFLNPALVARAFIFFAFPSVISGDSIWIADKADAFTGATPLANVALGDISSLPSVKDMFLGTIPGCLGETSTLAILIGAALLIVTDVASWRIILSVVIGGLAAGFTFNLIGTSPAMSIPPYYHLFMGGFMFGAVFMATDPVTSPHTNIGKIIYGLLIGILTVVIRVCNKGYAEGMMLSILLMNVFTPLIDYLSIQYNINKRAGRQNSAKSNNNPR